MKNKRTIRRIVVFAVWLLVISGITTLLIAANRKQKEHDCKKVVISIKGMDEHFYIEEKDVKRQLEKTTGGALEGRSLRSIPLALLEKQLESNAWIRNVELYFDREDVLHVAVTEREPIARVFTVSGNSFYIDSTGQRMPLLDKVSIRVPVVTGFTDDHKWNTRDSASLAGVKSIAVYLYGHRFWNEQIGEINITPQGSFELTPTVGNQVIRIGDATGIDDKLSRLMVFYRQVLSKTGFNKYSVLDVQYDGQVVAVNKTAAAAVDSIQLQKNIQELLQKSTIQNVSGDMLPEKPITAMRDSVAAGKVAENSRSENTTPSPVENKTRSVAVHNSLEPHKSVEEPKPSVNKRRKPKALMPRLTHA